MGKPKQLISDNALQFKLSSSVLEKMWKSTVSDPDVQTYVSNEDIKWPVSYTHLTLPTICSV